MMQTTRVIDRVIKVSRFVSMVLVMASLFLVDSAQAYQDDQEAATAESELEMLTIDGNRQP